MISKRLLNELAEILKKELGKNLSRKDLVEIADTLVGYFNLLAKINAREQLKFRNKNYENGNFSQQKNCNQKS